MPWKFPLIVNLDFKAYPSRHTLYFRRRVTDIRNIEVAEKEFSDVRPKTAPTRRAVRPRSPSHPNYKEEAYLQSTVVLRYVGHTDHYTRLESRARHRAHRKSQRLPPLPAHVDEVTIEQQPRGSYVLEVFHGYLAVGGKNDFHVIHCWDIESRNREKKS